MAKKVQNHFSPALRMSHRKRAADDCKPTISDIHNNRRNSLYKNCTWRLDWDELRRVSIHITISGQSRFGNYSSGPRHRRSAFSALLNKFAITHHFKTCSTWSPNLFIIISTRARKDLSTRRIVAIFSLDHSCRTAHTSRPRSRATRRLRCVFKFLFYL